MNTMSARITTMVKAIISRLSKTVTSVASSSPAVAVPDVLVAEAGTLVVTVDVEVTEANNSMTPPSMSFVRISGVVKSARRQFIIILIHLELFIPFLLLGMFL